MTQARRIAVVGVTGFIGRGLPGLFRRRDFEVLGVSRGGRGDVAGVDRWQRLDALDLAGCDAVVNLAGAPIDRRWTAANRKQFHESRVGVTRRVVEAIGRLPEGGRPGVLVNGSGVGYYGDSKDRVVDEGAPVGSGYLAGLCEEWEAAALEAEMFGVRVVTLRTGVALGRGGAAFEKLLRVFRAGLGGRLGTGCQWMPWIHVDDLRAAIVHAVETGALQGPMNGCAPGVVRNGEFTKQFGGAVKRPAVLPVPGFALKLALGGFGAALLEGQRARPKVLADSGFEFRFASLEAALADLL